MSTIPYCQAPDWTVSQWLNTPHPLTPASLQGVVTVLHVFQMLCPACVSMAIPQAKAIHLAFPPDSVKVVGLHSVFEHHEAMNAGALQAFVHEYRIRFPVGIDQPSDKSPIPLTMEKYGIEGTPTLILIDKSGHIRLQHLGHVDDLRAGALIGQLLTETSPEPIDP